MDGTGVSPANPVVANETIKVYAAGSNGASNAAIFLGDRAEAVLEISEAPPGINKVRVRVPEDPPTGPAVRLTIAAGTRQNKASLAVPAP